MAATGVGAMWALINPTGPHLISDSFDLDTTDTAQYSYAATCQWSPYWLGSTLDSCPGRYGCSGIHARPFPGGTGYVPPLSVQPGSDSGWHSPAHWIAILGPSLVQHALWQSLGKGHGGHTTSGPHLLLFTVLGHGWAKESIPAGKGPVSCRCRLWGPYYGEGTLGR